MIPNLEYREMAGKFTTATMALQTHTQCHHPTQQWQKPNITHRTKHSHAELAMNHIGKLTMYEPTNSIKTTPHAAMHGPLPYPQNLPEDISTKQLREQDLQCAKYMQERTTRSTLKLNCDKQTRNHKVQNHHGYNLWGHH